MISRLFQIVYLLMERESITARELSEKLEVSIRTINRDIEKLSEARIPVYTNKGRRGGISLLSDFVIDKKVLTEEERSDILSSMRALGAVGYKDEKEALLRLETFFGTKSQDWIEVEFNYWGRGGFDEEKFHTIKKAILERRSLVVDYRAMKTSEIRIICPVKMVFKSQAWYVFAYCQLRKDFRYFKLNRIIKIDMTDDTFDEMEVPSYNKELYVSTQEEFDALVVIDKSMAYRVYDEIPPENIREEKDCLICEIKGANREWFFDYVLTYGAAAEVQLPIEAREEVKRRLELMLCRYE